MEVFEYPILKNKHYQQPSVFRPENLIREARRQKGLKTCNIPEICVLDPDGDLAEYLIQSGKAKKNNCWACYHSKLYNFQIEGMEIGVVPHAVGASYAVLVAEQLFQSGCELLISITSAGLINHPETSHKFALITEAVRDEGTSYHYLQADRPSGFWLFGYLSTWSTSSYSNIHQTEICAKSHDAWSHPRLIEYRFVPKYEYPALMEAIASSN